MGGVLRDRSLRMRVYPPLVPKTATPRKQFGDWNGDPRPLLDAAEAVASLLAARGEVRLHVTLTWPGGEQEEESINAVREAVRFAAPFESVSVHIDWSPEQRSGERHICIIDTKWYLSVSVTSPDFALADQVIAVAVPILRRAEAENEKPLVSRGGSTLENARATTPNTPQRRAGFVPWVEEHPALTTAIVSLIATSALIIIAVATN